ncbi:MAG: RNA polymerase sigma factor [Armatimonas sp.]
MRRTTGTDDNLIQRAACGDQSAFAELVRRHRPWVHGTLRAFASCGDNVEDLTQEVFTQLHRSAGRYYGQGRFIPFLKAIALNVGRTYLRRSGRATLVSWEDIDTPAGEDVAGEVMARMLHGKLYEAIQTLPRDQRDAIQLRYFAGLSVPEIAKKLDSAEGTIKSRLHHGLRKLRAELRELKNEELS